MLFRPEKLPYWRKWDPVMLRLALSSLVLCAAAAAVLASWFASSLGWRWDSHGALRSVEDGLTYGCLTLVLLALDISGPGAELFLPLRLLYKLYVRRIHPFLTSGADRNVKRRLGDLKPEQVVAVSNELYARHVAPGLDEDIRPAHVDRLVSLQRQALEPAFQLEGDLALEMLRVRCEITIKDREDIVIDLPKPSVPRRRRDA